jgi:hypothetical protein
MIEAGRSPEAGERISPGERVDVERGDRCDAVPSRVWQSSFITEGWLESYNGSPRTVRTLGG